MGITRRLLTVAVAAAATGCGFLGPPRAEVVDVPVDHLVAAPGGPVVLVGAGSADGEEWAVHAFRSDEGVCISSRFAPFGEGGACGVPGEGFEVYATGPQSDTTLLLQGIVPAGVRVQLDFAGQTRDVPLVSLEAAGIAANGYVTPLALDALPDRIAALDQDGAVVDELVMSGP